MDFNLPLYIVKLVDLSLSCFLASCIIKLNLLPPRFFLEFANVKLQRAHKPMSRGVTLAEERRPAGSPKAHTMRPDSAQESAVGGRVCRTATAGSGGGLEDRVRVIMGLWYRK
jgi:hypothetical protein